MVCETVTGTVPQSGEPNASAKLVAGEPNAGGKRDKVAGGGGVKYDDGLMEEVGKGCGFCVVDLPCLLSIVILLLLLLLLLLLCLFSIDEFKVLSLYSSMVGICTDVTCSVTGVLVVTTLENFKNFLSQEPLAVLLVLLAAFAISG